jgi:hypothetical protein
VPATEIEAQRKDLEEATALELAEHEKFRLEKHIANELTEYHQRRL